MFFEGDRIDAVREMILAEDEKGRRAALAKILPYQKGRLHRHFQGARIGGGGNDSAMPLLERRKIMLQRMRKR